ncbi:dTDP-4-amino-4,6-dideoxygalactose transaminase [Methanococcoides vulcani]|uniref:dTDP-4-amino-4,6-dideoxygalactose transaminase n=1 Tax=Methanococcoides vulcani TaxID=1353158 RepID=A0A1I0A9J6_9EURY|nr:DegT/DnrJ/EryC1/StrS family aminotransferase [Methanococcoides vulcani]SES89906.1 dTDP-4-amino-4,6-dideoxygalactose transaminase [Methanococcoides vulcani]
MIPIAKPNLGDEEIDAVSEVLASGIIAEGKRVAEFESAFAEYIGTEHAIAVNSGTAALHAALLAHGIGKGDEVITTSFSFIATANSIMYTGARPVFVDIEPETFNIDTSLIEDSITKDTKALMPVHLYGHPAEMKQINEIAEDHNLAIIEDACQAHGATYHGKKVGSFGTGAFSFYPTKNMTTGEGGIITTDDSEVARKARMIRAHGSQERYLHEMLGYNFRMTDIAAAIGLVQLKKIDGFNLKRQKNAQLLSEGLKDVSGVTIPTVRKGCEHMFHQYTIRTEARDDLITKLNENGIGTGVYYPIPIHMQPTYIEAGYTYDLPVCEKAAKEVISLPVHPGVLEKDVEKIIKNVIEGVM